MGAGKSYIGIGVGAMIFNSKGEILLAQRGPKARNEQMKWEFPGGQVKYRETLKEAIKREIKEEFDIYIEPIRIHDIVDHILPDQHWIAVCFEAKLVSGEPKINEPKKINAVKFVNLENINEKELSIPSISNLRKYNERRH